MDEVIVFSVYLPFLVSALLGWLFIPRVLILSHRKRLFDMPDERKSHNLPVPRLGGITFLPILLMCVCLVAGIWVNNGMSFHILGLDILVIRFVLLFVGMMMLYLVGVVDKILEVVGPAVKEGGSTELVEELACGIQLAIEQGATGQIL